MPTPARQQSRDRSRRPAGRAQRLAVVVALYASALAVAAPAQGYKHDIGELLLNQPCCSGAALQGSRSHILFPNAPQAGNYRQVLSLVAAQDDALQTNELGLTLDDNLVVDNDLSCFKPYNTVVSFYEWYDYSARTPRCKALGQTGVGHLYSTAQQGNGRFQFFVDGYPQLSSPLVEMNGTHSPNADNVAAGGEVTYNAAVGTAEPVNWQASFGGSGNTPWQRFNNAQGWVTIQSSNDICNGEQNVCTGGGWSFSTGSFPTTWSVIH